MLDQTTVAFSDMPESELLEYLAYCRSRNDTSFRYDIECCIECLGYDPDNPKVREYEVTIRGRGDKSYVYAETPGKAKYTVWLSIHSIVPIAFTQLRAKLARKEKTE